MRRYVFAVASLFLLVHSSIAGAGMPAVLPFEVKKRLQLSDWSLERIQSISFFLLAILLCAGLVKVLWNYLQRDFTWLPRLSYAKALVGVFLWGLLFIIVLTMISGARELMTPGAWQRQGSTYRLADAPKSYRTADSETVRRQQLENLRLALWQFAATHNGRFPTTQEITVIPKELWEIADSGGLRFNYYPGRSAGHLPELLVCEPEWMADPRLVLKTNGDIMLMNSLEIPAVVPGENRP